MRLVEMKCKNCGANLKVDEDDEIVTCKYCNVTYKIDDESDNMEDSGYEFEKGRIRARRESLNMGNHQVNGKFPSIIIVITIIFMSIFMIFFFGIVRSSIRITVNSRNNRMYNLVNTQLENTNDRFNKITIK